jgi:mannose-6-phosphate isomerase-like protein (cupin superfamily)
MTGYVADIEELTDQNENFRQVLFTAPKSQLVVMTLQVGEDIGTETHPNNDQFIRIESGTGQAILNGEVSEISNGFAIVIPAGIEHNIKNTGSTKMKLYTLYSPPDHKDKTIHKTKTDAKNDPNEK